MTPTRRTPTPPSSRALRVIHAISLGVFLIALLVLATTSRAAVADNFTGWGYTVSATTSKTAPAWRYGSQGWQAAPRPAHFQVYLQPFAPGWAWTWDRQSGWLAMSTAYVRSGSVPGPENTGVPITTQLIVHNGNVVISTPGAVIDGWDIRGNLIIRAPNVTVRRSIIRGRVPTVYNEGIVTNYGAEDTNLLIEDSTIVPQYPTDAHDGFKGQNVTLRRVEILKTVDGIGVHGNNILVDSSWIHDLIMYTPYARQPDNKTHNDGIQMHSGSNIVVRNSVINGAHNAAIMITPGVGSVSNVRLERNLFDYGGCSVNVAEFGRGAIPNLVLTSNRFGFGNRIGNCAMIMPAATKASVTAVNNVWDYNGTAAPIRNG